MVVKLDISKAYDRVEWEFLQRIMLKIGLPEQWVNLTTEMVHTASYSTLINGEAHHPEVLSKETLCLHTCSFYVSRGSPLSFEEPWRTDN